MWVYVREEGVEGLFNTTSFLWASMYMHTYDAFSFNLHFVMPSLLAVLFKIMKWTADRSALAAGPGSIWISDVIFEGYTLFVRPG